MLRFHGISDRIEQFFLKAIVTQGSSSMCRKALERAKEGDLGKISWMVIRFVEKFSLENCDVHHVADWMFEWASTSLEAPEDRLLQKGIRRAICGYTS